MIPKQFFTKKYHSGCTEASFLIVTYSMLLHQYKANTSEILTPVKAMPKLPLTSAKPSISVPTAESGGPLCAEVLTLHDFFLEAVNIEIWFEKGEI